MKVLLQHPNDDAETGPWRNTKWDLIVDFGWSGKHHYAQLSESLGCRVQNYRGLLGPEQYRNRLRQILNSGLGNILDHEGIDWWDVFIPYSSPQLEDIMLMSALAEELRSSAEIMATRPHSLVQTLALLQNRKIGSFLEDPRSGLPARLRGHARTVLELRPARLGEIAFDKWDADYRLRRLIHRGRVAPTTPAILLPSSYGNVSRMQASYANMLPGNRFLQVVTRKSGRIADLPANLEVRSLASYVPTPFSSITENECTELMEDWERFQTMAIAGHRELTAARDLGVFAGFNRFLKTGLRIRGAWLSVFQKNRIGAVLSGDENNPYTRLPVLIARKRNIPTTFCSHGALDASLAVRVPCSDTYLAQGEMARDYWLGWCGLPSAKVVVGAPQQKTSVRPGIESARDLIVFFSEPYELESGRVGHFYNEILPQLCCLAHQTGRRVIVKLHPFESLRARLKVIDGVLASEHRSLVEVVDGPLTPDLLERAWCGLTVTSSAAVDCALNGIPCFLCSWFDVSWFEYGRQFERFAVAQKLASPRLILEIPSLIERIEPTAARQNLATPIGAEQFSAILGGTISTNRPGVWQK